MNAIEVLAATHQLSDQIVLPLFEDLANAPLETPFPGGGNHAHWILGHLTFSEGSIVQQMMLGRENPHPELEEPFRGGSIPDPEGKGYPNYEGLLETYRKARAETLAVIQSMTDTDLDLPGDNIPEEYAGFFANRGQCLMINATHAMVHRGQLADIRRRLDRPRILA